MFALLAALFQTAPAISPPPRPMPSPPAPPMVYPSSQDPRQKPYAIDVDVSAPGIRIWQGTLRVGYPSGASFQRTLTEALPERCEGSVARYSDPRDSFRITLNARSMGGASAQSFSLEWQRPGEDCTDGVVTRSVQLSGSVSLEPGESATLEGDAGLKLRLTRPK